MSNRSEHLVSPMLAFYIEQVREHLKAEFKSDYAFVIAGQGKILAAANERDGEILACPRPAPTEKAPELGGAS